MVAPHRDVQCRRFHQVKGIREHLAPKRHRVNQCQDDEERKRVRRGSGTCFIEVETGLPGARSGRRLGEMRAWKVVEELDVIVTSLGAGEFTRRVG